MFCSEFRWWLELNETGILTSNRTWKHLSIQAGLDISTGAAVTRHFSVPVATENHQNLNADVKKSKCLLCSLDTRWCYCCKPKEVTAHNLPHNSLILPFAASVRCAHRAGHRRGVQVARKLGIRNTHLKREVLAQLEAIITERRAERRRRKRLSGALLSLITTGNLQSNLEAFIRHSPGTLERHWLERSDHVTQWFNERGTKNRKCIRLAYKPSLSVTLSCSRLKSALWICHFQRHVLFISCKETLHLTRVPWKVFDPFRISFMHICFTCWINGYHHRPCVKA